MKRLDGVKRIVCHGGGAHRDDFLALAIALAAIDGLVEVVRRDPTAEELDDAQVLVLDVGGRYEPERLNFDHHQFARDAAPECALSLLARHLGIELSMMSWFEFTKTLDSKGPMVAAKQLGLSKEAMMATISPVEMAVLKLFESSDMATRAIAVDLAWMVGRDIVTFIEKVSESLTAMKGGAGWVVSHSGVYGIVVLSEKPEPKAIELYREHTEKEGCKVAFSVCRDDRGEGWTLYRFDDHKSVDFSRLEGAAGIVFAHKGGFIAKTKKMAIEEAVELVKQALVVQA